MILQIVAGIVAAAAALLFYLHVMVSKPRFFFADDFLNMTLVTRTLYLTGRYGGGKTSLAFILAAWLYDQGKVDTIHANVPSVLCEPPIVPVERACFVVDEAHAFLDNARDAKEAAAYLRKWEIWLLMPSVFPPHRRLSSLWCQRIFNGYVLGIPCWFYKWTVKQAAVTEKGYFVIARPDKIFGFYDTKGIPPDDGGLFTALKMTQDIEIKRLQTEQAAQWAAVTARLGATAADPQEKDDEQPPNQSTRLDSARTDQGQTTDLDRALYDISQTLADATSDISDAATTINQAARRKR